MGGWWVWEGGGCRRVVGEGGSWVSVDNWCAVWLEYIAWVWGGWVVGMTGSSHTAAPHLDTRIFETLHEFDLSVVQNQVVVKSEILICSFGVEKVAPAK